MGISPTPTAAATISAFSPFSSAAPARVWMPLAATEPNRTMPAPPRTGSGTSAMTDAATGTRPSRIRMPPPAATTKRLRTLVIATRPMFCANALHMKPLNSGLMALPRVSARSPPSMVRSSAGRSTILPRASMSAVDSVIQTSITMLIETIAAISNCGAPKWNGVGKPIASAFLMAPKSVMPTGIAMSVPMIRPSRMAICWRKPRSSLRSASTTTRVTAAMVMLVVDP